mmetsp:Transcript_18088/g.44698  ORF Transcript_18088/g.44698 Transcript_18088/m.44698 type:complete len:293 (+) Transcript_18088:190-1068(+)
MTKPTFPKAALFLKQHKRKRKAKDKEERSSFTIQSLSDSFQTQDGASAEHQKQKEDQCLSNLHVACSLANISVSDNIIFRFACYYDFDYEIARSALLQRIDDPHLYLRMEGALMKQFEKLVIFPLPGLRTKDNKHEVLYSHVCRHFPAETDTELLIKNMCYVFNDMSLTQEQCRNGVVFLMDLNQWTFKNFSPDVATKFLKALQHQVPTKVAGVLIVNGPDWFPKLYRGLLKKMLNTSFAKRVRILKKQEHLQDYLMDGFEKYLPVEMGYWRDSTEIVEDFIDMKLHSESNY